MVAFCPVRLRAKSLVCSNVCEGVGYVNIRAAAARTASFASASTTQHAQHASRGFAARILKCPTPSQIFE